MRSLGIAALAISTVAYADPRIVVCAPGSPGHADEAQPTMDVLARAVSAKAGTAVTAVYDPSDAGGVKQLAASGLGIVSLPFYVEHQRELGLHARLVAVQKGRPLLDRWALVVHKGAAVDPAGLAGVAITSPAAFAPGFIRGVVLGGKAPATIKLSQSTAILSALRHAADGQAVAVVVDGAAEAQLATLPFADKLAVIAHSPPLPAGLVVTIDAKLDAKAWAPIERALTSLDGTALEAIRMDKFVALGDAKALAAAVEASR
jgi:hypothetical protein